MSATHNTGITIGCPTPAPTSGNDEVEAMCEHVLNDHLEDHDREAIAALLHKQAKQIQEQQEKEARWIEVEVSEAMCKELASVAVTDDTATDPLRRACALIRSLQQRLDAEGIKFDGRAAVLLAQIDSQAAQIEQYQKTINLQEKRQGKQARALREKDAQIAELQKDAERYRWLRSEETNTDPKYYPFWQKFDFKLTREEKMDAAIDAAIAGKEAG